MGATARLPHDARMIEQEAIEIVARKQARQRTRISELRAQIDDRDETIRLLNEALSQALAELERVDRRAA